MHDATKPTALPERVQAHLPSGLQTFTPDAPLRLSSGVTLANPVIGYQTWGRLNSAADNVIWVCHALSGTSDVATWWSAIFGPGKALDPERYFIVCANILGGCYGSAGPLTHGGGAFPEITIADMVSHQRLLFEHLGIKSISLLLGGSMGGFQALDWAQRYPGDICALALVATAIAQPAFAIGLSELQCLQIRNDPKFQDGNYLESERPEAGLASARMLGHLSYRTSQEFSSRFGRDKRSDCSFEAWSYLQHQGEKLVARFDANSYLRINQAMNRFDARDGRGAAKFALHRLHMPCLVVAVDNDWLYPPAEQQALAANLPNARLKTIHSRAGHDGFLLQADQFEPDLRELLARSCMDVKQSRALQKIA